MTQHTPGTDDTTAETRSTEDEGQVSELHHMAETQAGGADSTDKSTGTAPARDHPPHDEGR